LAEDVVVVCFGGFHVGFDALEGVFPTFGETFESAFVAFAEVGGQVVFKKLAELSIVGFVVLGGAGAGRCEGA